MILEARIPFFDGLGLAERQDQLVALLSYGDLLNQDLVCVPDNC